MSKKERKRAEIDRYELEVLERLEKSALELAGEHQRRIDLVRGVALGLLYGIIGNLFVQHWYPIFEGLVLKKYDSIFWADVILAILILAVIIYTTYSYSRQLIESDNRMKAARAEATTIRRSIEQRKQRLDGASE
jgi:divalent metal cation (Fe/Co/Zn/Cd) transporter